MKSEEVTNRAEQYLRDDIKAACREFDAKRQLAQKLCMGGQRDRRELFKPYLNGDTSENDQIIRLIEEAFEDAQAQLEDTDLSYELERRAGLIFCEKGRLKYANQFGLGLYHTKGGSLTQGTKDKIERLYSQYRLIELMAAYIEGAANFYPWRSVETRLLAQTIWAEFISQDCEKSTACYWN